MKDLQQRLLVPSFELCKKGGHGGFPGLNVIDWIRNDKDIVDIKFANYNFHPQKEISSFSNHHVFFGVNSVGFREGRELKGNQEAPGFCT